MEASVAGSRKRWSISGASYSTQRRRERRGSAEKTLAWTPLVKVVHDSFDAVFQNENVEVD